MKEIITPVAASDGAGVRLKRSIATPTLDHLDPFFLFDHFGSENADDYIAGFPMHPHRGIETITYMLDGSVAHRDSIGNSGVIGAGDVQWMTAGSGILHEEMPKVGPRRLDGFQIWVNLPAQAQDDEAALPGRPGGADPRGRASRRRARPRGGRRRWTAWRARCRRSSPARPTSTSRCPRGARFEQPVPRGHTALLYVFQGRGGGRSADRSRGAGPSPRRGSSSSGTATWSASTPATAPARFLLLSAQPLRGACGPLGAVRHEHARGDRPGAAGAARRDVHQEVRPSCSNRSRP